MIFYIRLSYCKYHVTSATTNTTSKFKTYLFSLSFPGTYRPISPFPPCCCTVTACTRSQATIGDWHHRLPNIQFGEQTFLRILSSFQIRNRHSLMLISVIWPIRQSTTQATATSTSLSSPKTTSGSCCRVSPKTKLLDDDVTKNIKQLYVSFRW